MNALIYTLGVVVFVIGVVLSIALHELGHMYPAKKFGIKVTQYFVGFGNTVWSTKRGETEYGFKSIPLGGYVKLVGMLPPAKDADPHEVRTTNTGMFTQLISDARNAEYEHVDDKDLDRLFYRKPWWQKLIVMAGGPMVNVVIAIFLFAVVFMGFGALKPTTTVQAVSDCAISDAEAGRTCEASDPETPASKAGLEAGDRITAFNGRSI
ncbi:MAG: site-2 protease family protein, partial [Aeromicrobium sp.]